MFCWQAAQSLCMLLCIVQNHVFRLASCVEPVRVCLVPLEEADILLYLYSFSRRLITLQIKHSVYRYEKEFLNH